MDDCIETKFELSDKEKEIKAKLFNPAKNSNDSLKKGIEYQNPFTLSMHYFNESNYSNQTDLLQQAKNSLNNLSVLKEQPKEDEETAIKQLLAPLYEDINQLHQDIFRMNQLSKKERNLKPKDIHSLHLEMNQNKDKIKQTLDYVEENDSVFNDQAIIKAIDELKNELFNMNKELMEIQDDFEDKFSMIIKEKEREKIVERLMHDELSQNSNNLFSNQQVDISKKYLDSNVNYSDYHNDLLDIGYEQMQLYNEYQAKVFNLPKLVKPEEKVFFKYEDNNEKNHQIKKNSNNVSSVNDNQQMGSRGGIKTSGNKSQLDTAFTSANMNKISKNTMKNPMKSNESKKSNYKIDVYANNETNQIIDSDQRNLTQERDISVIDQMNLFQNKMSSKQNQIEVMESKLPQPRNAIMNRNCPSQNEIEPKSSKCKKSYQRFIKPKRPPVYQYKEERSKKNFKYKKDLYPYEPNITKNLNPRGEPFGKERTHISYPDDLSDDKMRDIISRIIEISISEKMGKKPGNMPQNRIDIEYRNISPQNPQGMDDLIRLLIQKFGDLENVLREGRGGRNDNIDDLAHRITEKIKADMQINVNFEGNYTDNFNDVNEQPDPQMNRNWNIGHESFILNKKQSQFYPEEMIKEEESLNPFETNRRVNPEELDNLIKMPHQINIGDYDVSSASSVFTDSKHIITREEKKTEEANDSNSLSRGQIVTDSEEEGNHHFNHTQIKNKTPLDLLLVKNINEHLSAHLMANQQYNHSLKQSENESNEYEEDESFPSANQKEIVHIDDNKRLKMLELYNSNEYNQFKQNYPRQGTNSLMQSISPNQIDNSHQLKLISNTQNDINSIMKKQSILTERFKQLALKNDIISESAENEKESKAYQTDESSELI